METKVKIKYLGGYEVALECPGFFGNVKNGDVVEVFESASLELCTGDLWEQIKTEKESKNAVNAN